MNWTSEAIATLRRLWAARISASLFAQMIRVDRATVSRWISGRSSPNHARHNELRQLLDAISAAVEAHALPIIPCATAADTMEVMRAILKKYEIKEV